MAAKLVFIHGRSQENKDASCLKREWVQSWDEGLTKNNLEIPLLDKDIHFPYYGDTLYDLASGESPEEAADIIIKGINTSQPHMEFFKDIFREVILAETSEQQRKEIEEDTILSRGGLLNKEWVQRVLKVLSRIPGINAAALALATYDVYQYLTNVNVSRIIDNGVRKAMTPQIPTVVVAHSLGTVVAYNLLRRQINEDNWEVPLFITLGSPLAVYPIKQRLMPIQYPACVGQWFNAMDERDVVALHPLTKNNFDVIVNIENKTNINNDTENHHGITGYLKDPVVAKKIYGAVTQ